MNALVIITRFFMAIGLLLITAATAVIIFPVALISKAIRLLLIVMLCSLAFTSCKKDDCKPEHVKLKPIMAPDKLPADSTLAPVTLKD